MITIQRKVHFQNSRRGQKQLREGEPAPATSGGRVPRVSRLMALAIRFDQLIRDAAGRATFWVKGKRQKIEVLFGPKFIAGEIYSPSQGDFICFEPMTAINNGLNLAHRGIYQELQRIAPGESWQESFWVRPSGY